MQDYSKPVVSKKLYFDEFKHQYTYGYTPAQGEIFISVTTLLGLFKEKFDSDYWSFYKGLQKCMGIEDKKEFSSKIVKAPYNFDFSKKSKADIIFVAFRDGITLEQLQAAQQEVLLEWKVINKTATTKGTKFHNAMENKHYEEKTVEHDGVFSQVLQGTEDSDLNQLHHPTEIICVPELRVFNEEYAIAGTMDQPFFFPTKEVDINDWKTNKKIDLNNKYAKMRYPLNHLDDCSYNHYCLQVSIYAWMLEQFGYKPRNLKFTHVVLNPEGEEIARTVYKTHYMKKEVVNMLNYYKNNKADLLNAKNS